MPIAKGVQPVFRAVTHCATNDVDAVHSNHDGFDWTATPSAEWYKNECGQRYAQRFAAQIGRAKRLFAGSRADKSSFRSTCALQAYASS